VDASKIKALVKKFPKLSFLESSQFRSLPQDKQDYVFGLIEDAQFWVDQDQNPESDNRFLFLGSVLGLMKAEEDADAKGLKGKERETYLKPQKQLQSRYNPYSGNVTAASGPPLSQKKK
jgi:hypothetical protein